MLREVVKVFSYMDWFRPILTVAQNKANGPSHTFLIPDDCGLSPKQVEGFLRKQGIKTWGLDLYRDCIMLSTTVKQAGLAQHLLEKHGVQVDNPIDTIPTGHVMPRGTHYKQFQDSRRRDSTWATRDPIDSLNDRLDSMRGWLTGE